MGTRRGDVVAVAVAACGFGCVSVLAKLAYEAGSSPASLLTTRLAVAAVAIGPLLVPRLLRGTGSVAWGPVRRGALGGVSFAAAGFLEFEALSRMPAAAVVVILFLAPVWVAVGSRVLWGRRVGAAGAARLGLVMAGIIVLVGAPGGRAIDPAGAAAALAASVLYAGVFLLLEDLVGEIGPLPSIGLVVWPAAMAACLVQPAGAAAELSDPATAWCAVAVGLLTSGSLVLLAGGLRTTPAFAASVVTAAEPVAAAALAWVVLGELLTAIQVAGAFAAVVGVLGIVRA
jgi:drug/metabolite transporter (DMT)-like permease